MNLLRLRLASLAGLAVLVCVPACCCVRLPREPRRGDAPRAVEPAAPVELDAEAAADPAVSPIPDEPSDVIETGQYGWAPPPLPQRIEGLKASGLAPLREVAPQLFAPDSDPRCCRERASDDPRARAEDEAVLLYRALYQVAPGWRVGRQGIGDCVSWGWAHGLDHAQAVDCVTGQADPAAWRPAATEAIYGGSRVEARGVSFGGWGDGSYGAAAAKWVRDWGAIYRQPYSEQGHDLTSYDAGRAKQWGAYGCGGRGDDGQLDAVAKQHPARAVALVTTFDEAAAAIRSGYPVPVCSGRGFSSRRDAQGFAAPAGSWSHCMCFIGVRFDRPGLLCLNSWGPGWISGPKWPADMPDGSFWVDARVAAGMLSGRDSFAVGSVAGFPRRKLHLREGWDGAWTPRPVPRSRGGPPARAPAEPPRIAT